MISYTAVEQRWIAQLPVYHPPSKNGRPRRDRRGEVLKFGHVTHGCVGVSIGMTNHLVYRAKHPKSGEWILVQRGTRIPVEHLLIGDEILRYILWQSILNKCFQKSHPSARYYSRKRVTCERRWIPVNADGQPTAAGTVESRTYAFEQFEKDFPLLLNGRDLVPGMVSSRYGDVGDYVVGNFEVVTPEENITITNENRKAKAARKK